MEEQSDNFPTVEELEQQQPLNQNNPNFWKSRYKHLLMTHKNQYQLRTELEEELMTMEEEISKYEQFKVEFKRVHEHVFQLLREKDKRLQQQEKENYQLKLLLRCYENDTKSHHTRLRTILERMEETHVATQAKEREAKAKFNKVILQARAWKAQFVSLWQQTHPNRRIPQTRPNKNLPQYNRLLPE
jgi:chromosome segregation ATPase